MYRKKGYIIARIVGFLAILVMAFVVAIQTPYFQTRLSKLALNQLAAIMEGRVQYDELKVMTSGVLVVRNLKLVDANPYTADVNGRGWAPADTVFRAKSITATFSLTGLFQKQGLHLGRVTVEDGYFHLTSEPGEYSNNISRIFHLKPSGKPASTDPVFDIKKFRIKNFRFRMTSFLPDKGTYKGVGINFEDLDVTADISGHNLKMVDAKISGTLDRLSAQEKSGYSIEQLSASVESGGGRALIEDLRLRDPWTDLSMRLLALHFNEEIPGFVEGVRLEGEFLRSRVALQTLTYFTGSFDGSPTVLDVRRGRFNGPVADLTVDRLAFTELSSGVSTLINGRVAGLPDIPGLTLDVAVQDLTGTTSAFSKLIAGVTGKAPDLSRFARGVPLTLQLKARGPIGRLDVDGGLTSPSGDFTVSGSIFNLAQAGMPLETSLNLGTRELDLGEMLGIAALGPVTMHTVAHAVLSPSGLPDASLDTLHIDRLHALGHDFHNLSVSGSLQNGTARGRILSHDPALQLDLAGMADLESHPGGNRYRLGGDIHGLDLAAIGIKDAPISHVATHLYVNLVQNDGRFDGRASLENLKLTDERGTFEVGNIEMNAETDGIEQRIRLAAPFVDADFRGDSPVGDFVTDLQNISLRRDLSALYTDDKPAGGSGDYDVLVRFHDTRDLLSRFMPGLYLANGTTLDLTVRDNILDGQVVSDRIAFGTNYLRNVQIHFDNHAEALAAQIVSTELRAGSLAMNNPAIDASADDNVLALGVHYDSFGSAAGEAYIHLDGELSRDGEGILDLRARPSDSFLTAGSETWRFDDSTIILHGKELRLDRLRLYNGPQSLLVDGGISTGRSDTLTLQMTRFDLALADEFLPSRIGIEGQMNGSATVTSGPDGISSMLMDFRVDTLRVAGADAGALQLTSTMHEDGKVLDLHVTDRLAGHEALLARASYRIEEKTLDGHAHFNALPLSIATPFLRELVTKIDGSLTGDIAVKGPMDNLVPYSTDLRIENGEVCVAATGVPYTIDGPLRLDDSGLYLDDVTIRDMDNGTCRVNAALAFKQFKDFQLNGRLSLNNFKLLDTPETAKLPVYGLLRASGTASARGPFDALAVDADLSTSGDGHVHIPLSGSLTGAKNSSLLTFTQSERELDPYEQMIAGLQTKSVKRSDITIRGHVTLTPGVRAFVEIDKAAGNVAAVSGQGSVNINLRPARAVFDLNGDYNISEGNYQFVLPGVLSKTFNVERGSSVKFGGDIMNTELDVTATYGLRTTLDPILASSNSKTRRQVTCKINVTDRLRNPAVNLDIEVPDLDPTTRTEVESALNTSDKVQKQFVSLLLLGSFMPDENSGVFSQSNLLLSNITEMMSGQINNILQRLDIPVDVGFGYQEINTGENLFDISLSTQLFENRVLLGGNFGNRRFSTGSATGDFTGNLDLQVKLDPEGKFRFLVFSHAADEFTSHLDFSQRNGIGISYQREYRTFQEFIRHLTVPASKREAYDLLEAEKQLRQVIIKIDGSRQAFPDSRPARRRGARRDSTSVRP